MNNECVVWIDYLRCIGLLLIIASHVFGVVNSIEDLLFGCNVAIMIFVSGYCSTSISKMSIIDYYRKRGKRLIIDSWKFFIIYFLLILIISLVMKSKFPYTLKQIIMTFLFLDGIGFTWIINIFIIIALIMPFIIYFEKSITSFKILVPCFYICFALIAFVFNYDTLAVKVVPLYRGVFNDSFFRIFVKYNTMAKKLYNV